MTSSGTSSQEEEEEKKKKKKKKKKRRRRSTLHRPSDDSAQGSPASRRRPRCPNVVAARVALAPSPAGFFLPTWERVRGNVVAARAALAPSPLALPCNADFFLPTRGDETSPHAGE
ncbi:hypothetical protein B296_00005609, partial [Ensete ventricosum]